MLKERYGDVQSVVNCHYTELISITPAINNSKVLRQLHDRIEKHLRSLEALNKDVNQEVFISIITAKLPKDILVQLEIQKSAKNKWTIGLLRELFNDCASAREKTEQHINTGISTGSQQASHTLRLSTEALVAGAQSKVLGSCRFCNGNHWNDECTKYPTNEARKQKIRGSCFICLKQGHKTNECTLSKSCFYCGQLNSHHRKLCPRKFGYILNESAHLMEELSLQQDIEDSTENALISSGDEQ